MGHHHMINGGALMDYSDVKSRLAPCGLDCSRCADYIHGEIKEVSTRLVDLLGNYGWTGRGTTFDTLVTRG